MSFLSGIISSLTGGLSSLIGIGSRVVGGIGDFLEASGIASLAAIVTQLTGGITSLVTTVAGSLQGIISPIMDSVNAVRGLAQSIEDGLIAPIIRPIVDTVTEVKGLASSIDRLVGQGLSGIIEIPKVLADSLGSIDANWKRSTELLAAQQLRIAKEILVPGLTAAIAPGLARMSEALIAANQSRDLNPETFVRLAIDATWSENFNAQGWQELRKMVDKPEGFFQEIIWAVTQAFRWIVASATSMISMIEDGMADARFANPTKVLGAGEAIALWRLGVLSKGDASKELQRNGYNQQRQEALFEGSTSLPSPGEAITWWQKSLIDESERDAIMAKNAMTPDAIRAAVAAASQGVEVDQLLTWVAKGYVDQAEFIKKARGKGYDDKTIRTFIADALQDPQVNTAINWHWNALAASAGWFGDTYSSEPPSSVVQAAKIARIDPLETVRRWQSQFAAMPVSTAITLFFRGELSRKEVEIVVAQNGFPRDMSDLLIKAQSPLLPSRSVPSLVAKGQLSVAEGMQKLKERGYSVEDASILLAAAAEALTEASDEGPTDATKITISQARNAYRDAIIDKDELRALLRRLSVVEADIDFLIEQDDFDLAAIARKDEVDTIKAEVTLGTLTVEEAVERLFALELSEPEVTRLVVALRQAKRASAKVPDLGLLKQLGKASLITREEFTDGVEALGYDPEWALLIAELQYSAGGANDEPDTDQE